MMASGHDKQDADKQEKIKELREAFRVADESRTGRLTFEEFFELLKKGNPKFPEPQAETLFVLADQDMSGEVDFEEFVNFIFKDKGGVDCDKLFCLESNASEEECKQTLMSKPGPLRSAASKAVKARGSKWADLTWKERLDEVHELEKGQSEDTEHRSKGAPTFDPTSTVKIPSRKKDRQRVTESPKSPQKAMEKRPTTQERRSAGPSAAILAGGLPKGLAANKFAIADMGQAEIVTYSLQEDDLSFAGNPEAKAELRQFREMLKTASSPVEDNEIVKFIAKGTAGWVFLAESKATGKRSAMKLIRMTQARSGIKEWYCSKVLRALGYESGVVLSQDTVRVVDKREAPPVIQEQLENAGPVKFFLCLIQELMPWGTLEDLAKEGELSPEIMFKCLEDVAQTLAVMHENGLQHRDVKPENIMLQMDDDETVVAAKLCDFGSAQVGNDAASCRDDIRRFGVTLFSVATGEGWTKNRLIREDHGALVTRLSAAVEGSSDATMKKLPGVLERILSGSMKMADVSTVMSELADAYDD